ncbi:MAG: DedA family protein [Microcoleaceae cyanobacterium]
MSSELLSLETLQALAVQYGYWAVFLGIALENAGVPLPGETITLVGGFLAGSGELNYWYVLGFATLGAILGDNCGYWIGRWQGWPLVLRVGNLFRLKEEQLLQVRARFSQNAAKAVLFGRFVALLRIFAGPLAGIAQMPYWKFFLCNAIGAISWASVMVSLSYFVGHLIPLEQLVTLVGQFALVILGVVITIFVVAPWMKSQRAS